MVERHTRAPYFAILGPVEASVGGTTVRVGPRERRALAALLLAAPRPVMVDRLIDVLWDADPPVTAKAQVHNSIARLRRGLDAARSGPTGGAAPEGSGLVVYAAGGYRIEVGVDECDALAFATADARSADLARRGRLAAAVEELRDALGLWRGPALGGLGCAALQGEVLGLEESRLVLLERRIELDLALGRQAELTAELAALVAAHPTRERLVELQMTALHRAGRRLEALEVFGVTRARLAEQTGLDPRPELQRIHRAVLANDPTLDPPSNVGVAPRGLGLLPGPPRRALPRFIGRAQDLAELDRLIAESAVVTITGPPGAGKTRLAIEAMTRGASDFSGGVALVALDPVRDGAGVANAILDALPPVSDPWRTPVENILRALAGSDALLVLDNCEHVVAECARVVAELVAENPQVRVLVTSQVPLGLPGERRYALGPLSTPVEGTVDAVAESEAGRLLIDRANLVEPGFVLTAANAEPLARLCRTVDGLPLALELAAGRLRAFSIGQIADRLNHQLELLTSRQESSRHASLRAAIDWSYGLLSHKERLVFDRLSVFLGGFSLEAAEAVVGGADLSAAAVADTLGALVERSLVVAEPTDEDTGDMRYRVSEALRAYAAHRLAESGDPGTDAASRKVRSRHAEHFRDVAETACRNRRGPDRHRWLNRLREEYGNIRSAMVWAHQVGAAELTVRMAAAMTWFWRGYATREAVEWLRTVLPATATAPAELRQRALIGAGSLALRVNIEEARDYVAQAVALARDRADRPAEVIAISFLASVDVYRADVGGVSTHGSEAVALARRHADPYLLARTLVARALTQAHVGAPKRTDADLDEAMDLFGALDDRLGQHEVRLARAEVACAVGNVEAARAALAAIPEGEVAAFAAGATTYWMCRAWLALASGDISPVPKLLQTALGEMGDRPTGPYAAQRVFGPALDLAAALAVAEGDHGRAVTLRHAATSVLTLGGSVPERAGARWSSGVDEIAEAVLGPAGYAAAAKRGAGMGLAAALIHAGFPVASGRWTRG